MRLKMDLTLEQSTSLPANAIENVANAATTAGGSIVKSATVMGLSNGRDRPPTPLQSPLLRKTISIAKSMQSVFFFYSFFLSLACLQFSTFLICCPSQSFFLLSVTTPNKKVGLSGKTMEVSSSLASENELRICRTPFSPLKQNFCSWAPNNDMKSISANMR
jgi:hypothetical protein